MFDKTKNMKYYFFTSKSYSCSALQKSSFPSRCCLYCSKRFQIPDLLNSVQSFWEVHLFHAENNALRKNASGKTW